MNKGPHFDQLLILILLGLFFAFIDQHIYPILVQANIFPVLLGILLLVYLTTIMTFGSLSVVLISGFANIDGPKLSVPQNNFWSTTGIFFTFLNVVGLAGFFTAYFLIPEAKVLLLQSAIPFLLITGSTSFGLLLLTAPEKS